MQQANFRIEILEQGWLEGPLPEEDLCSHGRIKLTIGGQAITSGDECYGISESALALLRTLVSNHSSKQPLAQRLIFHGCGAILMMGCPIGVNWSVTHSPGVVRISQVVRFDTTNEAEAVRFSGLYVDVPSELYREQVCAFASKAKELFTNSHKSFTDDFDRQQYESFWTEFTAILDRESTLA